MGDSHSLEREDSPQGLKEDSRLEQGDTRQAPQEGSHLEQEGSLTHSLLHKESSQVQAGKLGQQQEGMKEEEHRSWQQEEHKKQGDSHLELQGMKEQQEDMKGQDIRLTQHSQELRNEVCVPGCCM